MADERSQQRSPETMMRELEQTNPEAARSVSQELEQAASTLKRAMASTIEPPQPSQEEQIREAGDGLAQYVQATRDVSPEVLGQLTTSGIELDQERTDSEATSDTARWLAHIAQEPESEPTPEPSLEHQRNLSLDQQER